MVGNVWPLRPDIWGNEWVIAKSTNMAVSRHWVISFRKLADSRGNYCSVPRMNYIPRVSIPIGCNHSWKPFELKGRLLLWLENMRQMRQRLSSNGWIYQSDGSSHMGQVIKATIQEDHCCWLSVWENSTIAGCGWGKRRWVKQGLSDRQICQSDGVSLAGVHKSYHSRTPVESLGM